VEDKPRKSEASRSFPGSIFSFLPAHGGSRVGAVAEQLSRTLAEGLGAAVLLAGFQTRGYPIWCQDDAPRRLDGRTWGAFVTERDGVDILDAPDVTARELAPLLAHSRATYSVTCVDLTDAASAQSVEALRASDAIFVVAGSDRASLEIARDKVAQLHSMNLHDRCSLLLQRKSDGLTAADAEEITGLPVCSLIDSDQQIAQLARWLAANASQPEQLAMAG